MSDQTITYYDPSYKISEESLFHDVVLQLAYNLGHDQKEIVNRLTQQLQEVLTEVGGKRDAMRANVEPETYGITVLEVGKSIASSQAAHVAATIVNAAQEFAEFVTMDLEPYIEREPGEENLTSEDITAKVMFAMVTGAEYNLGRFSRDKASTP